MNALLREIDLFLLDMDGTFYLGEKLLPGAKEFLHACEQQGTPYTFLTNNSSQSDADYITKLANLGVDISPQQILTSGYATLLYMQQTPAFTRDILLIGTPSLEKLFTDAGYTINAENPSAVVLGYDTGITYEKLVRLCDAARSGLPYIATHPDLNCPVENGFLPDIGAVIAFVRASSNRMPDKIIGKPHSGIAVAASQRFNVPLHRMCMVGDRLYTDIALGGTGVKTALVLTGETSLSDLAVSEFAPDFVFKDLAEMALQISEK